MKKLLPLLFVLLLLCTACGASPSEQAGQMLALDVSGGTQLSHTDTHSGFHGDGASCTVIEFADDRVLQQIQKDEAWQPLPLDDTTQALVYGLEDGNSRSGPYLTDGQGAPMVPPVKNGYYRLIDRHSDAKTPLLERASFNFTLGLYDADISTLYCCELDT